MSVNVEALKRIEELEKKYEQIYGKAPDINDALYLRGMYQERLVEVLERMIDENESSVVAYGKLFGKQN